MLDHTFLDAGIMSFIVVIHVAHDTQIHNFRKKEILTFDCSRVDRCTITGTELLQIQLKYTCQYILHTSKSSIAIEYVKWKWKTEKQRGFTLCYRYTWRNVATRRNNPIKPFENRHNKSNLGEFFQLLRNVLIACMPSLTRFGMEWLPKP